MRAQAQNFQRHTDATLSQLRAQWREGATVQDGNENFLWQLFEGSSNYANLDVTGNFQQIHPSLNYLVSAAGVILPLCKADAVADLSVRVEALGNATREAELLRKQAQQHVKLGRVFD